MDIQIIQAEKKHAPYLAKALTMAIGDEIVSNLAGSDHTPEDVLNLFEELASRTDTQYSYLNSKIAVTDSGEIAGVEISYDGADLHKLRPPFFQEAEKKIGLKIEGEPEDETGPEEFYLDTLAVFPSFRRQGIGRRLIEAAASKAANINKPLGLLVSKKNPTGRKLYDSVGFVQVGERPFAGEMMNHLILEK